jgi:Na+/H+ antiporter NhaD/arsenite permease-like protein
MPAHDPIALGLSLPLWSVVPFAGLLLSIALLPLFAPSLWARHYAKVCLAFGVPVAAFFLLRAPRELLHTVLEYASFIILLASLFTISGGILLRGTLRGSAGVNGAILAVGAVLANVFGTTGASMLLVRPLLRANAHRHRRPTSSSSSSSWWRTSAGRSLRSAIRPCSSATCGGCRSSGRCARWARCGPSRAPW